MIKKMFIGILVLIGVLIACIPKTYAEEATVTMYGAKPIDHIFKQFYTAQHEPAYCYDAELFGPAYEGSAYKKEFDWAPNDISYLMMKSFPITNTFNGKKYTDHIARLISQTALWMYRGYITENGVYTEKTLNGFKEPAGQKSSVIAYYEDDVRLAAVSLVKDTIAHGATAQIPQDMKSKMFYPSGSNLQRIIVPPYKGSVSLAKSIIGNPEFLTLAAYNPSALEFEIWNNDTKLDTGFSLTKTHDPSIYKGIAKGSDSNDKLPLSAGVYKLKEVKTPPGIIGLAKPLEFEVLPGKTTTLGTDGKISNHMDWTVLDIVLKKIDNATKKGLAGAEFEFSYSETKEAPALRTWKLKTDSDGLIKFDKGHLISGDAFYTDSNGKPILPFGYLTIKEIQAPSGYSLPKDASRTIELSKQAKPHQTLTTIEWSNQQNRFDFSLVKKEGTTKQTLANIPFKITAKSTGESHVFITNDKGVYHSKENTPHTTRTNALDSYLTQPDESLITEGAGLWFAGAQKDVPHDTSGALLKDTYLVEELRCEANKEYELAKFELTPEQVVNNHVDCGEILNFKIGLKTKLTAQTNERSIEYAKEQTLTDHIEYTTLDPSKTYEVRTTFKVLKENEEPKDLTINGKTFEHRQTFRPEDRTGAFDVVITLDGDILSNMKLVCFEEVYLDGQLIAAHCDINDQDQTLEFLPKGKTIHKTGTGFSLLASGGIGLIALFIGIRRVSRLLSSRNVW